MLNIILPNFILHYHKTIEEMLRCDKSETFVALLYVLLKYSSYVSWLSFILSSVLYYISELHFWKLRVTWLWCCIWSITRSMKKQYMTCDLTLIDVKSTSFHNLRIAIDSYFFSAITNFVNIVQGKAYCLEPTRSYVDEFYLN